MSQNCCVNNPCDARTHKLPLGRGMQAILDYTPPSCHQTKCGLNIQYSQNPTKYSDNTGMAMSFFQVEPNYLCGANPQQCIMNDELKPLSTRWNDENKFRNSFMKTVLEYTDTFNGISQS